jgi:hypothetical protein
VVKQEVCVCVGGGWAGGCSQEADIADGAATTVREVGGEGVAYCLLLVMVEYTSILMNVRQSGRKQRLQHLAVLFEVGARRPSKGCMAGTLGSLLLGLCSKKVCWCCHCQLPLTWHRWRLRCPASSWCSAPCHAGT